MNVQAALAAVVADLESAAFRLQRLASGVEDSKAFTALKATVEEASKQTCAVATAWAVPAEEPAPPTPVTTPPAEEPKIVKAPAQVKK